MFKIMQEDDTEIRFPSAKEFSEVCDAARYPNNPGRVQYCTLVSSVRFVDIEPTNLPSTHYTHFVTLLATSISFSNFSHSIGTKTCWEISLRVNVSILQPPPTSAPPTPHPR